MVIFDAHNDLLTRMYDSGVSLWKNSCHIDFNKILKKKDCTFILCCAIFINGGLGKNCFVKANDVLDYYENCLKNYSHTVDYEDFDKMVQVMFSLEGAAPLEENVDNVDHFYKRGVRVISLTWNDSNQLAGGCNEADKGLTGIGKAVLDRMAELGMILDLSHISDKAFFEASEYFQGRIIASHSNARSICNHRRNLTDEQIKVIRDKKGVIGVNLYPSFLTEHKEAGLNEIMYHIEHIISVAGIDCVGFGFDFDGIDNLPNGINGFEDVVVIIDELKRVGFSEEDVEKICGENFCRVFNKLIKFI